MNRSVLYVALNDPIPAGTEMVLSNLRTTQMFTPTPMPNVVSIPYDTYWGWYSYAELKTEQAILTTQYLRAGTYRFTYTIRASTPGTYRVIPPNGHEFYFPEVFGRGAGTLFTIR